MESNKLDSIYKLVKELTAGKKIGWTRLFEDGLGDVFTAQIPGTLYKVRIINTSFACQFVVEMDQRELGRLHENVFVTNEGKYGITEFSEVVRRQVDKIDDGLDDLLNQLKKIQ